MAAVGALPRGSVNTAAIRNGAVTTPKLANKAVTLAKLASNARIAGPKGDPGSRGATGSPGAKGDIGPIGPSDAYVDTNEGPISLPALTDVRVATVSLPSAGTYTIWAKATLHADPSHTQLTSSGCRLGTGSALGPSPANDVTWAFVAPGALQTVSSILTQQVAQATAVNLYCLVSGLSDVSAIKLVAIKVGTLTSTTG